MQPPTLVGSNDARQAIRMRIYSMTAATTALAVVLMLVWYGLGMLQGQSLLIVLATTLLLLVVFFWIFRTGKNLCFADASLTQPQMTAASATLLGTAYAADSGRAVFLVLLVMVGLFGALRLRTRTLLMHAVCVVAGYALVIGLLQRWRPDVLDLPLELLNLLVFGPCMLWFALMAGYISELRERLKAALRTVAESERTLAEAQRLAQFGSWSFDPVGHAVVWSEETYRIFGLDPKQQAVGGADFRALVHEEDRERYLHLIEKALGEGQEFNTEYRISTPSGGVRWVHALAQPIPRLAGDGPILQGMVMDITQRKTNEDQIRQLAHFDVLTGLPNRNLLMQLLHHAVAKAQRGTPLAVLFIDLDGFKAVNDWFGHEVGDALLAAFAQRLSRSLRLSDTAARLGGDEFVVVIDDFTTRSDIETVAERILIAAMTPF
ncbi:MAG: diguanylate cyclase [Proteobacteria bacterium]|nr:MAG: diguanylate cyclase [Pseudomonadota bacterium]